MAKLRPAKGLPRMESNEEPCPRVEEGAHQVLGPKLRI